MHGFDEDLDFFQTEGSESFKAFLCRLQKFMFTIEVS